MDTIAMSILLILSPLANLYRYDVMGFSLQVKWYLKEVIRKEFRRQEGRKELVLSPETLACQNSTHLHHFTKKISPKEVKIRKYQP